MSVLSGAEKQSGRKFETVAVLMGGPSAERDVSLRSGAAVTAGLREAGYAATAVDVDTHELRIPDGTEAAFIALHGEFGEDGGIQGILDGMGLPYTGSGSRSSDRSFDKVQTKEILIAAGVPTPRYEVLCAGGVGRTLPLPVVAKPARQGSSIGVTRVFELSQWEPALADSLRYDSNVIVEAFIPGRELTVGIVGREALPVIEIRAPEGWYNYKAKYTKGQTEYLVPAPISDESARACQRLAMETFDALGCRGLARVDFRMTESGDLYVLELNTIPGFTETSLLPKAAAEAGIRFADLCDRIMQMATHDA